MIVKEIAMKHSVSFKKVIPQNFLGENVSMSTPLYYTLGNLIPGNKENVKYSMFHPFQISESIQHIFLWNQTTA